MRRSRRGYLAAAIAGLIMLGLAASAAHTAPATRAAALPGRFVFSCSGCPQNPSGPSLFVVAATGAGLRELVHSQPAHAFPPQPPSPYHPRWSPQGGFVAFSNAFAEIWRVNASTGALKRVTRSRVERDDTPAWSPDGKRLVYSQGYPHHCSIVTSPATGGTPRLLVKRTGSCFSSPDWSPDGRHVIFHRSAQQLFLVNANGQGLRPLTTRTTFARYPRWSPNGKQIAFVSSGPSLIVMNADGSQRRTIVRRDDLNFNVNPAWSPDGHRIAFIVTNTFDTQQDLQGNQILTVRLDGTDIRPVEIPQIPANVYSEIYGLDWK